MEIPNPRRILAVSLAQSAEQLSRVIKDLTGSHPQPSADNSLAGITHELQLRTAYYTTSVSIWLDVITSSAEWANTFLTDEAKEVLDVLGGLIVVFAIPASGVSAGTGVAPAGGAATPAGAPTRDETKNLLRHVGRVVREGLNGWEWDGVGLGVGVGDSTDTEEWDECCAEWGLEFVHVKSGGGVVERNEFGEKMGVPRVLEALEANDWAQATVDVDSDFGDFLDVKDSDGKEHRDHGKGEEDDDGDEEFDPENLDFGFDRADFAGLKKAIWSAGQDHQDGDVEEGDEEELDDEDVQKLERMMLKLQAVRDTTAGMSEEERKRIAKRAVGEVMKEL